MTKHPEMTHSSSFLGCIKPIGLRFFKVAFCDLEVCSSAKCDMYQVLVRVTPTACWLSAPEL